MKISMTIFEIFDLKIFARSISKCSNFFHNKPFWSFFFKVVWIFMAEAIDAVSAPVERSEWPCPAVSSCVQMCPVSVGFVREGVFE